VARFLLDTCTFLWIVGGARELSPRARAAFADPANDVLLSAASAWEIAVKHRLGKLPLPSRPDAFVPAQRAAHGIEPWPVDEEAALHVAMLPDLHRDPFDRMLVAQAIVAGLIVLTPDEAILQYAVRTLW
jgi:PIN domain nuclease of toxin-antitoxin system